MNAAELDKPCPSCHAKPLIMRWGLAAKPLGTWSLAGAQLKTSAWQWAEVHCAGCDWTVTGRLEDATFSEDGRSFTGGHFIAS